MCWYVKNLYRSLWMSQKLSVYDYKKKKKKSRLTQKFLQNYDDDSKTGYIDQVDVSYFSCLQKVRIISCSCLKERRLTNSRNLNVISITGKTKLSMNSKLTLEIGIFCAMHTLPSRIDVLPGIRVVVGKMSHS